MVCYTLKGLLKGQHEAEGIWKGPSGYPPILLRRKGSNLRKYVNYMFIYIYIHTVFLASTIKNFHRNIRIYIHHRYTYLWMHIMCVYYSALYADVCRKRRKYRLKVMPMFLFFWYKQIIINYISIHIVSSKLWRSFPTSFIDLNPRLCICRSCSSDLLDLSPPKNEGHNETLSKDKTG